MSSLTPNHGLIIPDATDPVKQVREDYATNLNTIDGMGGGHTIVDPSGTDMPTENKLQFTGGVQVSDDNVNGATVVNVSGGNSLILNAMIYSEEEKVIGVWTDKKPLYQKSWDISDLTISYNSWTISSIPVGSMETIVNVLAINQNGKAFWGDAMASIEVDPTYIGFQTGRNGNNTERYRYVTIQYTKTTDVAGSGGFQAYGFTPVIYSDTERVIGVWRDNKPLYKKTWFFNSTIIINANAWTSLGISAGDIENVVMKETVDDEGRSNTVNYCGVRNSYISAYSNLATNIQVLTLYYTKTTDVAGSGDYNTLGVPTVHYSNTEQVVGTAEDGRPLYQITVDTGTLPNNTTKNVAHGISDLDYIEHFWGSAKNPNNGVRIPLPYVYGNTRCLQVYADSTNIKLISTENMSGYTTSRVTLQYTKTTDL